MSIVDRWACELGEHRWVVAEDDLCAARRCRSCSRREMRPPPTYFRAGSFGYDVEEWWIDCTDWTRQKVQEQQCAWGLHRYSDGAWAHKWVGRWWKRKRITYRKALCCGHEDRLK